MNQFGDYIFILLAAFCVIRGIMTIVNGKASAGEEAKIMQYSGTGIRRYRILSATINIVSGLFLISLFVLKIMNIIDPALYKIVGFGGLAIIIVVYIIVRNSCKKVCMA